MLSHFVSFLLSTAAAAGKDFAEKSTDQPSTYQARAINREQ